MPRKKSAKGKPVDDAGTEMRSVRLELTPEFHKRLRQAAADREMSMAALARAMVEESLSRPAVKRREVERLKGGGK
jgi:predicted DNA-binding ribbon-helix-helix protein